MPCSVVPASLEWINTWLKSLMLKTLVVAGATGAQPGGLYAAGTAYVFEYDGSQWNETAILRASDEVANEEFGSCVALLGDLALLGRALRGRGTVEKGGHRLHHAFARAIADAASED